METTKQLREVLASLGYASLTVNTQPFEVVLSCAEDSWRGEGATEDHAFHNAVRQAFPSAGARKLLGRACLGLKVKTTLAPVPTLVPSLSEATTPERAEKDKASIREYLENHPVSVVRSVVSPVKKADEAEEKSPDVTPKRRKPEEAPKHAAPKNLGPTPTEPQKPEQPSGPGLSIVNGRGGAEETAFDDMIRRAKRVQEASKVDVPERKAVALPKDRHTVAERMQQLEALHTELRERKPELAMLSPSLLKLELGYYAFLARAIETEYGIFNEDVKESAYEIVRAVSDLAAAWWPGMIFALQLHAVPRDAFDGFKVAPQACPSSWDQAATETRKFLDRARERGTYHITNQGWSDEPEDAGYDPKDSEQDETLDEVEAALALVGGCEIQEPIHSSARPTIRARAHAHQQMLADATLHLRWIRNAIAESDPAKYAGTRMQRWGALMGRARQIANYSGGAGYQPFRNALDPATRPDTFGHKTWALVVDKDPHVIAQREAEERRKREESEAKAERAKARHTLVAEVPVFGSAQKLVEAWVERAIPVMTNPEIAGVAYHLRPQLLAVDPDQFDDRQVRSRLRRLAKYLANQPEPEPAPGEDDEKETDDEQDPTILKIRDYLAGKKVLFVSNRRDKRLEQLLADTLDIGDLDFRDAGEPRKVQAVANAIAVGSHDIVLMVTSFNSHTADHQLSKAAKKRKIPYVRVSKGRPTAVAVAIEQALAL